MTSLRLFFYLFFVFGLSQKANTQNYPIPILEEYYQDNSNNIKINILSLTYNAIIVSYERALTQETSVEARLKWLGAPLNDTYYPPGLGADIGYKIKMMYFLRSHDSYAYKHLLHGAYIKPLMGFNYINDNYNNLSRRQYRILNVGMETGKQFVFNNSFLIDMYIGFHFYGGSERLVSQLVSNRPSSSNWNAGDLYGHENTAYSFGLRLGILFCKYENEANIR